MYKILESTPSIHQLDVSVRHVWDEQFLDVTRQAHACYDSRLLHSDLVADSDLLDPYNEHAAYLGMYVGSSLVATASLDVSEYVGPKDRYIHLLGVKPEYHGHGFGSTLLNAIETQAKEQAYRSLSLLAHPAVWSFYERHDFEELFELQGRETNGATLRYYVKEL